MTAANQSKITFSFGENWLNYLSDWNESLIKTAAKDIDDWIGNNVIKGRRVIDIGSGSGLSSLCIYGARPFELVSFDYDPKSVEATKKIKESIEAGGDWKILHGSILNQGFINNLGLFDIVYSWGVLHHTGDMWSAISNAQKLCKKGGLMMISIYQAGDLYEQHLNLKQVYNESSESGKEEIVKIQALNKYPNKPLDVVLREMKQSVDGRAMNEYNDLIDWLGGLPYEVAYPSEIICRFLEANFEPIRIFERGQGGCTVYLFRKIESEKNVEISAQFKWEHDHNPGLVEFRGLAKQISEDFKRGVRPWRAAYEMSPKQQFAWLLKRAIRKMACFLRSGARGC
jgi:2-polyprenyl-6-hydroxyphenyl methylase/3-demethylubiquinone-9 3-methyltransferase